MITLKNETNFVKTFPCLCSVCRTEFSILLMPNTNGGALCPQCGSEKIFVEYPDNQGNLLFDS